MVNLPDFALNIGEFEIGICFVLGIWDLEISWGHFSLWLGKLHAVTDHFALLTQSHGLHRRPGLNPWYKAS